jgi:hypothetical protein
MRLFGFLLKKFVTMHGHMNLKFGFSYSTEPADVEGYTEQ